MKKQIGPPFVYVENHDVVGYDPEDPFVYGEKSVTQKWEAKGWRTKFGGAKKAHSIYEDDNIGTTLKEKAIEWMKSTQETIANKPFFLYLASTNIHHPFTPAPQFVGTSECGRYGDFIHELDWMVGEVLLALDEMGISDNTLVIFTSDNGGMLNRGGQDAWQAGHRLNGDLLGFKFGAWEGGHRVPFIARWPGKIAANSKSDQLLSHVDLLATFANIVGESVEDDATHDSVNMLEALTSNPEEMIRKNLIISANWPSHLVARKGKWVFLDAQDNGGFRGTKIGAHMLGGAASTLLTGDKNSDIEDGRIRQDAPPSQLYDLSIDLSQTTNLYLQYPEIVGELRDLLDSNREKIGPYPKLGMITKR